MLQFILQQIITIALFNGNIINNNSNNFANIVAKLHHQHREYYRYHYHLYCHLLKRYLQCKYCNLNVAHKKYSTLINLIQGKMSEVRDCAFQLFSQIPCPIIGFNNDKNNVIHYEDNIVDHHHHHHHQQYQQ